MMAVFTIITMPATLRSGVVVISGDSCVSNQHCTNLSPIDSVTQYLFAMQ